MGDQIPVLIQLLEDAKDGDVEALQSLDLDLSEDYNIRFMRRKIAPQRSDHDEMLAGFDDLVHLIEPAKRLKNHTQCRISQQAFAHLSHIYTSMFDEKPTIPILDGEAIADTMKDLVNDVTANMDFLLKIEKAQKRRQKGEDSETSEDEDPVSSCNIVELQNYYMPYHPIQSQSTVQPRQNQLRVRLPASGRIQKVL